MQAEDLHLHRHHGRFELHDQQQRNPAGGSEDETDHGGDQQDRDAPTPVETKRFERWFRRVTKSSIHSVTCCWGDKPRTISWCERRSGIDLNGQSIPQVAGNLRTSAGIAAKNFSAVCCIPATPAWRDDIPRRLAPWWHLPYPESLRLRTAGRGVASRIERSSR
jgi:hypothetical protein